MNHRPRILIFTGEGKGKTTAALGMALRAAGHGQRVCVIQFVKNDATTGELAALGNIPGLEICQTGLGFIPRPTDRTFANHRVSAQEGCRKAAQVLASKKYHLVVLDEICIAIARGLIEETQVIEMVKSAGPEMVVVLTGRYAGKGLMELADTVTEMQCVKHGYQAGLPAREGVEF